VFVFIKISPVAFPEAFSTAPPPIIVPPGVLGTTIDSIVVVHSLF
jgi:hypothetical protein